MTNAVTLTYALTWSRQQIRQQSHILILFLSSENGAFITIQHNNSKYCTHIGPYAEKESEEIGFSIQFKALASVRIRILFSLRNAHPSLLLLLREIILKNHPHHVVCLYSQTLIHTSIFSSNGKWHSLCPKNAEESSGASFYSSKTVHFYFTPLHDARTGFSKLCSLLLLPLLLLGSIASRCAFEFISVAYLDVEKMATTIKWCMSALTTDFTIPVNRVERQPKNDSGPAFYSAPPSIRNRANTIEMKRPITECVISMKIAAIGFSWFWAERWYFIGS